MLSTSEMESLIDEIIDLGNKLRTYHELAGDLARAYPAPSQALLDAFEKQYADKISPSYIQLLSIHDGLENFDWLDVSILSIEYLMEHDNLDEDWVEAGVYDVGEVFIFAQSNSDAQVIAFLVNAVDEEGEMEVVHFDASGSLGHFKNMTEYLKSRRNWFEQNLAMENADRAGLSDDE